MHPLSRPDRDIHMLAEILKTAGFYNYAYTTWIYVSPVYGFDLGFDRFNYIPKMEGEKLTDRYLNWLGKNKGLRGFHFLHYWDPHYPYTPERKYETHWQKNEEKVVAKRIRKNLAPIAEKYRDRIGLNKIYKTVSLYDSEILYTDHTLGRIFDELKNLDLYDKTMIIVTSDHGDEFWEHGGKYHEKTVYNEIIHVPLIIKLPGSETAGTRINIPVSQLDVMPTILDYLGEEQPKQTQGRSLLPLIRGGRMSEKRVVVSETTQKVTNQKYAFVYRNYHYIYSKKLGEKSRTDNQNEELFDISEDPMQQNNISTEKKDILKRLRAFKDNYIELMKPFYLIRHRFSKMLLDENTIEMLRRNGYLGY